MSSSRDRAVLPRPRAGNGPRVGVIRGVVSNPEPITATTRVRFTSPLDAQRAADEAHQAALDQGYADGYQAGLVRAAEEAAADAEMRRRQAVHAVEALQQAVIMVTHRESAALDAAADQTARLALEIAEMVLGTEITTMDDAGLAAIARAIRIAPADGPVGVRLNPADVVVLEADALDQLAADRTVTVTSDPTVASGGCVLTCGATTVDATVAGALARVAEVLGA